MTNNFTEMSVPVVKVDNLSREVVAKFPSYTKTGLAEGLDTSTIRRACVRRALPIGRYYYYRHADDFVSDEDFTERNNCPVVVINLKNNEARWFASGSACAQLMSISKTRLSTQ